MDPEKLRESSQFRLLNLISSINGNGAKDLAIHGDLMKPLDQVVGARKLRDHGIDKMFRMASSAPQWKNDTRIYLIPATDEAEDLMMQQLLSTATTSIARPDYHVIVVPKVLALMQAQLEAKGVLDLATFHSFSWDFIPLDSDLISLEMTHSFRRLVNGDRSLLASMAKAIMSFECLYGRMASVTTLGPASAVVHRLLEAWHREVRPTVEADAQFDRLIVLDRELDLASVLLIPLTYEGVLDENFGSSCGFVTLPPDADAAATAAAAEVRRFALDSTKDDIYAEIRGKHISSVFGHLSKKAKHLQGLRDKKNTASIEEMKHFVAHDLKHIQAQQKSLALHISACELVMKRQTGLLEQLLAQQQAVTAGNQLKDYLLFIEDSMARGYDRRAVLRLLCLYSLLHQGLPDFNTWCRQYLQAYGYEHLGGLRRLQRLGVLVPRPSDFASSALSLAKPEGPLAEKLAKWTPLQTPAPSSGGAPASASVKQPSLHAAAQRLQLTAQAAPPVDADAVRQGRHASYVFGGAYTPLVYRLVERCLARDKDPAALDDLARCYGNDLRSNVASGQPQTRGAVLVLMIGGVTYAEAAALHLLGRQTGRRIVVAATNVISGPSAVDDLDPPRPVQKKPD